MNKQKLFPYKLFVLIFAISFASCNAQKTKENISKNDTIIHLDTSGMKDSITNQWTCHLSDEEYNITQLKATEAPFTGKFYNHKEDGIYTCKCCGSSLFKSETKYDSGSGWPSFYDVISKETVSLVEDKSHGMIRTEIVCSKCNAHLGHVFPDGPQPTGLRYCINSASMNFVKDK